MHHFLCFPGLLGSSLSGEGRSEKQTLRRHFNLVMHTQAHKCNVHTCCRWGAGLACVVGMGLGTCMMDTEVYQSTF